MILYPTETIYALGVNALDEAEVAQLFQLKGRAEGKGVSWLVRDIEDIARYGELSDTAATIAKQFLPGALTLVVPARSEIPDTFRGPDDTVSFRISPDPIAQQVIADFMKEHDAPLTCTSANVSGQEPQPTVELILEQFKAAGRDYSTVNRTIDGGPRSGTASTVVRVLGNQVDILRAGAIPASAILESVK